MTWPEQTIAEFLAALRSPAPTPGGGSAAALAGAVGAALLAMVGSMASRRDASDADGARLQEAGGRAAAIGDELARLVDRDSAAYEAVMAAYKLPRSSEEEKAARTRQIQAALREAAAVPLEVMRQGTAAAALAATVAALGNPNASSDVGVAIELLGAAVRGAQLNVAINLESMTDQGFVAAARDEVRGLLAGLDAAVAAARQALSTGV